MSHETPNQANQPNTIYARPEMRSDDPRDRGHIVGGWKLVGTKEGTILQHDRYKDIFVTQEDYPELDRLQAAMSHLAINTLGAEGQPLPEEITLSNEEKDPQGRDFVDDQVLARKQAMIRTARQEVSGELRTLDATKPFEDADRGDVVINRGNGVFVSPFENSRLEQKAVRDAARR